MKKLKFFFVILFLQLSGNICSQVQEPEPISVERLGTTVSPMIVPKGKIQAEIGGSFWRRFYESSYYISETEKISKTTYLTYFFIPAVLIRYGLFNFAELRMGFQFNQYVVDYKYKNSPVREFDEQRGQFFYGWSPLYAGLKVNFLKGKEFIPVTSLTVNLAIPLGDYFSHMDKVSPEVKLAFMNKLPAGLGLKYNFGYLWNIFDSFTEEMGTYSAALNYDLSNKITVSTESFGIFEPGRTPRLFAGGGFSYLAVRNIMFDLSGRGGLTDRASNYSFSFGVSLRLPE